MHELGSTEQHMVSNMQLSSTMKEISEYLKLIYCQDNNARHCLY